MSTQLPAHLLALFNANPEAASIGSSIESNSFNTIRYTGSKFKLVKATGEEIAVPPMQDDKGNLFQGLDVIVVGINEHKSHVVYAEAYDPKAEPKAPLWSSDDGTPVPAEHETKVISDYRRWAVLVVGHETGGVFELRVSAASITNGDRYITALKNNGAPIAALVTRLTFDAAQTYPKLVFTPAAYIDEKQSADLGEVLKNGKIQIATAIGTQKRQAQLEAPKAQGQIADNSIENTKTTVIPQESKRGRKKAEPVAAPSAAVFTLPQTQPSAAAATVIAPKPTDAGLDSLLFAIMNK